MTSESKFGYEYRLKLKKLIEEELDESDWKCICKSILIPNEENITINKGGVCFCLNNISDDSVIKIKDYIEHKQQFNE